MKKFLLLALFAIISAVSVNAQKFALMDMEYVLKNIPAYERANEQLTQQSKRWQAEVDDLTVEAQNLYKKYQSESIFLSDEQRTKREQEILAKEKLASELKRKYFGPEGELYKKRESLMAPIQDEIYNAVKEICESKGYSAVVDRASAVSIIYASPKIDISNEVLAKLGYSN
ncbi:MAG: OmpH family outer membrane protein [Bacteroidales bacterium]|nr:OmpH family outer membrane protein [Bacteroidales bacterium]MBR2607257.1 OmpH family outer membrane protein [Bacteroidaceae bacterium]